MIQLKSIREINDGSTDGKLLFAALAILTSLDTEDIESGKWGGMTHPDTALDQIQDLANRMYFEEEWKALQTTIKRDNKIKKIIDDKK